MSLLKGIMKTHVLARSLAVKTLSCLLISLVHCAPLLLYFSVSWSVSILFRVHAFVLFKVALIVSTIELASFKSARDSLYEAHPLSNNTLRDVNSKGSNDNDGDNEDESNAERADKF